MYELRNNLKKIKIVRDIRRKVINFYRKTRNLSLKKSHLQHFILISNRRSGSTCIQDLLDCHPQIATDPHTFYDYSNLPKSICKQEYTYSSKSILGYKFNAKPENLEINTVNAEIATKELLNLSGYGIKIIYLRRKNILKTAISGLVAKNILKKRNYNLNFKKNERKQVVINSFVIDLEELLEEIKECETIENFNQQVISNLPSLNLIYEEDLEDENNHQRTLNKVCDFLKVDHAKALTRYAKVAPGEMSEYLTNYDDLVQKLKDTPYEQYLD